jgi:hypothetical protein
MASRAVDPEGPYPYNKDNVVRQRFPIRRLEGLETALGQRGGTRENERCVRGV